MISAETLNEIEKRAEAALEAINQPDWYVWRLRQDRFGVACSPEVAIELVAEIRRLREALWFGLHVMMPEIHAQKSMWPGEVDDFEERAREALGDRK